MCHGDLTLELPEDKTVFPQRVSGAGSTHQYRDWGKLIMAIKKRAIARGSIGWRYI